MPDLTSEQMEQLCTTAEEAARRYILSHISVKDLAKLNIVAEAEGTRPTGLKVDVDIALVQPRKGLDLQKLARDATAMAFDLAENFLRGLACHSEK